MHPWLNRLRFWWALLTKGSRLGADFLELTNRRFCNSASKIVGWHRGYPSYYLLAPPVMSRPALNGLTTRIMSVYQWRALPDFASLAVTDACNCACEHCSATSMASPAPLLSTGEWRSVIRQAQDLGVSSVAFVGGEPLLREDVCELVASVDGDRSQAILFTNGWALAERARDLARAGLTSVLVSLDSADAAEHDRRKALPGAFDRALAGVEAARRRGLLVGISAVVRPGDVASGALGRLCDLGRRLRVNQLLFFDAVPTGGYLDRAELAWSSPQLDEIVDACAAYQRRADYPGVHCYAYSKSHRGIGCAGGVSQLYVSAGGEVCPCDFDPASVGNVRDAPLHALWDRFPAAGRTCTSLDGCRRQKAAAPRLASCERRA
ncbi:MAG TPA: radical SAM/SPASM domain-containing protein [Anaeromyxobacter sp.]|nr:radical SAM/SPASM domain-containing protein [Anaeromyxobacter sp.]